MGNKHLTVGLLAVALVWCQGALAGDNLYRYRDHSGDVVINDSVPPEFVAGGYEVLSRSGRVVEVIAPQGADDENRSAAGAAEAQAQQREDALLLRSYSTLFDLKSARDRRLQLLDREIDIVETNLVKSRQQLEVSRTRAANYQRSGKVVSQGLLSNIASLTEQIQDAEQMAQIRGAERETVSSKYQRYIERFMVLTGRDGPLAEDEKNRPSKLAIDPASAPSGDG